MGSGHSSWAYGSRCPSPGPGSVTWPQEAFAGPCLIFLMTFRQPRDPAPLPPTLTLLSPPAVTRGSKSWSDGGGEKERDPGRPTPGGAVHPACPWAAPGQGDRPCSRSLPACPLRGTHSMSSRRTNKVSFPNSGPWGSPVGALPLRPNRTPKHSQEAPVIEKSHLQSSTNTLLTGRKCPQHRRKTAIRTLSCLGSHSGGGSVAICALRPCECFMGKENA